MNIFRIFNRFAVCEPKVLLGRWGINSCQKEVNKKIDRSNEDHCGPCSYTPIKSNIKKDIIDSCEKEIKPIHVKNKNKITE